MRMLIVLVVVGATYLAASLIRHLFPGEHPYRMDWWHFATFEAVWAAFMFGWGAIADVSRQIQARKTPPEDPPPEPGS